MTTAFTATTALLLTLASLALPAGAATTLVAGCLGGIAGDATSHGAGAAGVWLEGRHDLCGTVGTGGVEGGGLVGAESVRVAGVEGSCGWGVGGSAGLAAFDPDVYGACCPGVVDEPVPCEDLTGGGIVVVVGGCDGSGSRPCPDAPAALETGARHACVDARAESYGASACGYTILA